MFIVTLVFIIGMIFAIQQNLAQYSRVEIGKYFEGDDFILLTNIRASINETVKASESCGELKRNIDEVVMYLEGKNPLGYFVDIKTEIDCDKWGSRNDPCLSVYVFVMGRDINSEGEYYYFCG